jgi:hypothetical protein
MNFDLSSKITLERIPERYYRPEMLLKRPVRLASKSYIQTSTLQKKMAHMLLQRKLLSL